MKIIERDKDQANKKKNVGDYNLKFNIGIGIQILIAHIYLCFEVNFGIPFNIIFRQIIFQFETQGFKILTLETVQKSKLKQTKKKKSYNYLKTTR